MITTATSCQHDRFSVPDVVRNEARLRALRQYHVFDSELESAFERAANLAAHLFEAPMAAVNVIGKEQQWFRARLGLDEKQTGLDVSFCVHTIDAGEVMIVENLAEDERFEDNPYVTERGVRFYAGAPLITPEGHRLGTLCVLDTTPRFPSPEASSRLADLAAMVVDELQLRKKVVEHERAHSSLRQSRERLRVTQRLAGLGYWTRNLQTGELTWSSETRRIFGWPPEKQVTFDAFMEGVHPDDRKRLRKAQEAAMAGDERLDIEYRIRRPSGEERVLYERGVLFRNEENEPVAFMGAVLDITKRVRRRDELEEAKETAEEANRIKTALLSNMNHELRTPLTSIISFAEVVSKKPELADRFADRILGGGKRLLYTLNTVMDFADIEGKESLPSNQPVHLGEIIQSVASEFRRPAQRKDVELTVEIPEGTEEVVLDAHAVERVLTHLLHNAVKFTSEGTITVSVQMEANAVELRVADTGIGIAPDVLPQVFDEFAQASTGYDRTHEGNGLGLTVAKRLVDRADGQIDIESEPGEGTEVIVRLPIE